MPQPGANRDGSGDPAGLGPRDPEPSADGGADVRAAAAGDTEAPEAAPIAADDGATAALAQEDSSAVSGAPTNAGDTGDKQGEATEDEADAAVADTDATADDGEPRPGIPTTPDQGRDNYLLDDAHGAASSSVRYTPAQLLEGNMLAINTLADVLEGESPPTPEQCAAMARYRGWGGNASALKNRETMASLLALGDYDSWDALQTRAQRLSGRIGELPGAQLQRTVNTSFYTPPAIARSMWSALRRLGVTSGEILEPAVGAGHFLGTADDRDRNYAITGIDIDPIACHIAQQLYPRARIINTRLQDFNPPAGHFDAAISNVPFSSAGLYDRRYAADHPGLKLHDYNFLRAIEAVRPGGVIAFLTSYGTLDKANSSVREAIADQCNLLRAVRLPNKTFSDTTAGCDLIILQRRTPDMAPGNDAWLTSGPVELSMPEHPHRRETLRVNHYFQAHPEHVLGTMGLGYMQGHPQLAVARQDGRELHLVLDAALADLPKDVVPERSAAIDRPQERVIVDVDDTDVLPIGSYVLAEDGIRVITQPVQLPSEEDTKVSRTRFETQPAELSAAAAKRVALLLPVRDAAMKVIQVQLKRPDNAPALSQAQAELTHSYDAFVKRYGFISAAANARAIVADPMAPLLYSLELWDAEKETAAKSEIFTERTIAKPHPPEHADNVTDALGIALGEQGRVSIPRVAALTGLTDESVIAELRDRIYRDPDTGSWDTAEHYLSGNVRAALERARAGALLDPQFARNVAALEAVQPAPLSPADIDVGLGAAWVPPRIFAQYFASRCGLRFDNDDANPEVHVRVLHNPVTGSWSVTPESTFHSKVQYGELAGFQTDALKAQQLMEHALNQTTPTITIEHSDGTRTKDEEAMREAQAVITRLRDEFGAWVWAGEARRALLLQIYNDTFNGWVERVYDGSHLTFPGMAATRELRKHQADFVWRVIADGNALAAHVVGAGKTAAMAACAMECRRLNLANKPMLVVPNHLLYDFTAEFKRFYPGAHLLMVRKEDLSKKGRTLLAAKVATRQWDAVIVTQETFSRLRMSADFQTRFLQKEINSYKSFIQSLDGERGWSVKRIQSRIDALEARIERLTDEAKKDDGLCFDQLGVDFLLVDEADKYKNLDLQTRMSRMPGIQTQGSQRAFDLLQKTRYLMALNGEERGVVFATGTPVSNSMVELFTMQKYLSPSVLERARVDHFDAWAATFGQAVSSLERSPDGSGYRLNTRFSRFVNVPEMVKMFRSVADVKMRGDLNLPVPESRQLTHVVEPDRHLRAYMRTLALRAAAIKSSGGKADKGTDNMLAIATDGRHASLDLRTLSEEIGQHLESTKVAQAAATIHQRWQETAAINGVNMVFCDLSTPKRGRWSLYNELKERLVALGTLESEIAFIHDAANDAAKSLLFQKVRTGQVRVLVGSTEKMGTGTDVQNKITDLHHIDPPWRPRDVEQRDGRAIRQGNTNDVVNIHTYVRRDSFDEFMWEGLRRKAGFIAQALTSPDKAMRRIEEETDPRYVEIMAVATGNPMIREKVELDDQVDQLHLKARMHEDQVWRAKARRSTVTTFMGEDKDKIARIDADLAQRAALPDSFVMTVCRPNLEDVAVDDRERLGQHVLDLADALAKAHCIGTHRTPIGRYAGVDFSVEAHHINGFDTSLSLVREGQYPRSREMGATAIGISRQIEHLAGNYDSEREALTERVSQYQREYDELAPVSSSGFEHADELTQAATRLREVNEDLMKAAEASASAGIDADLRDAMEEMTRMTGRGDRPLVDPELLAAMPGGKPRQAELLTSVM